MRSIDLRYPIPVLINSVIKSQHGAMSSWENSLMNPQYSTTPTKAFLLVFLLLFFPFISVQLSLPSSLNNNYNINNTALVRFHLGKFSPHLTLSLLASLVFPPAVFWYAYITILIFAFCFPKLIPLWLRRFLGWLNAKLSAFPVWNLHISSTLTTHHVEEESQAPVPQVVVDFTPQVETI